MTKTTLAKAVGLTPRRIADYENYGDPPPPETLAELATALEFPVEYFNRPEPTTLGADRVSFRSYARLSASSRDAALASAGMATEVAGWIDQRFNLPDVDLPELRDLPPAVAASALRSIWSLGELPAPNLVHLMEMHGVRVFSLPDECAALDAVSAWIDGVPFVFLTRHKSPERARWDAAHELGHLLLHVENPPQGREEEQQADEFAREFLLPERGFIARAPRYPSLVDVRQEKVHWQVSALAYIRRLHHLAVVTDWQYKSLVIEASQAGYRREEGDIEREDSQLMAKVIEMLHEDGMSIANISSDLAIPVPDLQGLMFSPVLGYKGAAGEVPAPTPNLRLVR
jgi:Zn-dependent peptidase ImmA (M78 family)